MNFELEHSYSYQRYKLTLSKQLVLLKTHKRSTALRKKEYQWILQSIDYIAAHGTGCQLDEQYETGLKKVEQLIQQSKQQIQTLRSHRLPILNERYISILNQQLPDFFQQYEPSFHAAYCKEDLDYPLLDGLALEHEMYHKQGIDLVCEYMRRYTIEETFLHTYQDEVITLMHYYELHHDIELSLLGCNLCEIVLQQALFSCMLSLDSLLITAHQATFLCEKLIQIEHIEDFVHIVFQRLLQPFSEEMQVYLYQFYDMFVLRLQNAIQNHTLQELIITPASARPVFYLQSEACDPAVFQTTLELLPMAANRKHALQILQQATFGISDYLDVFHMELLDEETLWMLFASFDAVALAALFYQQYQEQLHFHQRVSLQELSWIEMREGWEEIFLHYLTTLDETVQKHVLSVFQKEA